MAQQEEPHALQELSLHHPLPGTLSANLHYIEYEAPDGHATVAGTLSSFDVFALIVNKMVGTGVFTAPPLILSLAGNPRMAIVLWAVGFMYSILGMLLYLSFAAVLPYNTGLLLYSDEISSYDGAAKDNPPHRSTQKPPFIRRHLGNGLFTYTVYAILLVVLFNSGTNSLQVGRQILLCYGPNDPDPNQNFMRLIAMTALSVVCLIHYFSASRKANRWFCMMKLAVLLILLGNSMKRAVVGPKIGFPQLSGEAATFSTYAQALMMVVFSFEGWENASFVAGEIPSTSHNTLRIGSLWAVTVVGSLYLLLNITYVFSIDTHEGMPKVNAATSFAPQVYGYSTGAIKCWAVLTAVSAMGSLISSTYTFSRVKQSIGAANILPHSDLWKRGSPGLMTKTPKGGLILHCLSTIGIIWAIVGVHDVVGMVTLPGIIQTYAHCLIDVFLTLGLPTLYVRATALDRANAGFRWIWAPKGLCAKALIGLMFLLYASCSLFIITTFPLSTYSGAISGWIVPAIVGAVLLIGMLYYFIVFWASASKDGTHQQGPGPYDETPRYPLSILSLAGVKCMIKKVDCFGTDNGKRARRLGSRRSIIYQRMDQTDKSHLHLLLYWLLGGRVDNSPLDRAKLLRDETTQLVVYWVSSLLCLKGAKNESPHRNNSREVVYSV